MLADMVLETGLPFEVVVGFTETQFVAVQASIRRRLEIAASGITSLFGSGTSSSISDNTEELEAKVKRMKKTTGKMAFDLWEVV